MSRSVPSRRRTRTQRDVVSQEIVDTLLGFIRSHWYRETPIETFMKDRSRLLAWVVFEAAHKLDDAAVTLPGARYLDIHMTILREALTHGGKPTYVPAYLRYVVQSHWRVNWDRYYDEAKALTPRIEECVQALAAGVSRRPDPVQEMAAAKRLISTARRTPKPARPTPPPPPPPTAAQIDLF